MNELVTIRHHPVVGTNTMRGRILEILVVKASSPIGRRLAFQKWNQAWPCISAGIDKPAASRKVSAKSIFETMLEVVLPGLTTPGHRTRRALAGFLKDPALVEPAMLAEIEPWSAE